MRVVPKTDGAFGAIRGCRRVSKHLCTPFPRASHLGISRAEQRCMPLFAIVLADCCSSLLVTAHCPQVQPSVVLLLGRIMVCSRQRVCAVRRLSL
eukprot:1512770-Rhodomonas_salina.3